MNKIIKNQKIEDNSYSRVLNVEEFKEASGNLIAPLALWQEHIDDLKAYSSSIALELEGDCEPELVEPYLPQVNLISIHIPVFSDGRAYSLARLLRERYGFQGDLRASGDVLIDQLFYLHRCGFNEFELREDQDMETALSSLKDFSVTYQAATDEPLPLFKRG